jgi:hypothetical protein
MCGALAGDPAGDGLRRPVIIWDTWAAVWWLSAGLVDALVIGVAERLNADAIATSDHRHFSVVRPRHLPAFKLLPEASD